MENDDNAETSDSSDFLYFNEYEHEYYEEDDDDSSDSESDIYVYGMDEEEEDMSDELEEDEEDEENEENEDNLSEASTEVSESRDPSSRSGSDTEIDQSNEPDEPRQARQFSVARESRPSPPPEPLQPQDDDVVIHSQKRMKLDLPEPQLEKPSVFDETTDEDQKCPICLETWTNAGEHRLCSLRCGHLFGLNCITQWFNIAQNAAARKCPECNTKASKKDIRVLYAKKLSCIDTTEIEKLQAELKIARENTNRAEKELSSIKSKELLYQQEIYNLRQKVQHLEMRIKQMNNEKTDFDVQFDNVSLKKYKLYDICNNATCRVMGYNPWNKILVASSGNALTRIFLATSTISPSTNVHNGLIRDLAFQEHNPNYILSVGFDKQVVLTDIRNNITAHTYKEETVLWSCCWSNYNNQTFFVGGAKGNVTEYDIRYLQSSVSSRENTEDRSPVVSLASVPRSSPVLRAGGYLVCQLSSCYAYSFKEGNYVGNQINIEGPFTSLRYNEKDNHVLVSCRASAKNPTVRHMVCSLEKSEDQIQFNTIHSFNAGNTQKLLSRPCYLNLHDDTIVIANNESLKSIVAWSVSSGQEIYKLPMSENVVDMCSFERDTIYQAVLTLNKLHLYQIKNKSV